MKEGNKFTSLQTTYTFWYSKMRQSNSTTKEQFDAKLIDLCSVSTVEEFWGVFLHMRNPSSLETNIKIFLFEKGIKPLWEDERNQGGGRFYFRVNKDIADRIWQDLVLDYIGDDIDFRGLASGLQIACKPEMIVISIWVKEYSTDMKNRLLDWIEQHKLMPGRVKLEYQSHYGSYDKYSKDNRGMDSKYWFTAPRGNSYK
jgi:translation initiation factor 4E